MLRDIRLKIAILCDFFSTPGPRAMTGSGRAGRHLDTET